MLRVFWDTKMVLSQICELQNPIVHHHLPMYMATKWRLIRHVDHVETGQKKTFLGWL
jgi:hypothetical protein